MTNAEAIEVLRNLEYHTDVKIRDVEAIGLAIEALQYENLMRDKIHNIRYDGNTRYREKKMTINEAIPILHDIYNYYNNSDVDSYVGFDKEDNEALKLAIKTLEEQKWIPITERLPEKTGEYLVSVYKDLSEVHVDRYDSVLKTFYAYIPRAWMPLPEPYGE